MVFYIVILVHCHIVVCQIDTRRQIKQMLLFFILITVVWIQCTGCPICGTAVWLQLPRSSSALSSAVLQVYLHTANTMSHRPFDDLCSNLYQSVVLIKGFKTSVIIISCFLTLNLNVAFVLETVSVSSLYILPLTVLR